MTKGTCLSTGFQSARRLVQRTTWNRTTRSSSRASRPKTESISGIAIGHLHDMVHLAGSVLEAKTEEAREFLDIRQPSEGIPDTLQHMMTRSTIEDTIAGLNGMALLYTVPCPTSLRQDV